MSPPRPRQYRTRHPIECERDRYLITFPAEANRGSGHLHFTRNDAMRRDANPRPSAGLAARNCKSAIMYDDMNCICSKQEYAAMITLTLSFVNPMIQQPR